MSTDIATLAIKVDARDTDKASRSLDKLTKHGGKADTKFSTLGRVLNKTALAAGVMATVIGGVLAVSMVKVIGLASELEETQGKFDVVFRGMAGQAEGWSKKLVDSYAMSTTESKLYLSSIQDLLVPTGMAREAAGAMSNEFVKLAADLGSFNNTPTATVVRDIQSALAGGSETLTKYGINVKVAQVKQEALTLGLIDAEGVLTDQIRAQTIMSIAIRQSSDAMGDMARTSQSYANQSKLLTATLQNVATVASGHLLPVATSIKIAINEWIGANRKLIDQKLEVWANKLKSALTTMWEFAQKIWQDGTLQKWANEAATGLKSVGTALGFIVEHKEVVGVMAAMAIALPKVSAAASLANIAFTGLSGSVAGLSLGLPAVAVGMAAFFAAYKAGEWVAMGDASDELAVAVEGTAGALAKISESTGYAVSSMEQLTTLEKEGLIRYEATLGMYVRIEQAKKQGIVVENLANTARQEAIAKEKESIDALANSADKLKDKKKALAESTKKQEEWTEKLAAAGITMGEEALAYEASEEGMYGYKTAMELAFEESESMDEATKNLTDSADDQTTATGTLAEALRGMATDQGDLTDKIDVTNTAMGNEVEALGKTEEGMDDYTTSMGHAYDQSGDLDASVNTLTESEDKQIKKTDILVIKVNRLGDAYKYAKEQAAALANQTAAAASSAATATSNAVTQNNFFTAQMSRSDAVNITTQQARMGARR